MSILKTKEIELGSDDIQKFHTRYARRDPDSCWDWTRNKTAKGYGVFKAHGVSYYAHRISLWLAMRGELSPTRVSCHRCDNTSCINPNHLFAGSLSQNMKDAVRKRRAGLNGTYTVSPGMVKMIWKAKGPYRDIAYRFGVSQALVSRVKSRKTRVEVDRD